MEAKPRTITPVETRKRPRCPDSLSALAMLTSCPVRSPALPRLHVAPRTPDGTLAVYDRVSGEEIQVYAPRFKNQFRAGHRAGLWYLRPAKLVESGPHSQGFATARAAVEAIRDGRWALARAIGNR